YPSVLSQTTHDFEWLVLLDDRCSGEFREDIEALADGVFTPVWTHADFRRDTFAAPVAERASGAPYLITTRIDSDDAMAVDFMATVQAQFAQQDRLFVSITRGVQIDRSGGVYRRDQLSNPFLSRIEKRQPDRLPDTVYV
ncbi:glycosyltransferase, partial [Xanthobacter autotrophicus]|uniref:glycosyltransferase n=1 Tax=Xanthobacter autotrophicus TaxID=280 RepID=UPI0024A693C3